jgi:hypothetical protein
MAYTTHGEYIADNASEKITLAHLHARKRLYGFTADSGLVSRVTTDFVNGVTFNGTALTSVASTGALTDATKYFYDIPAGKLYLYAFTQASDEVIVEYRYFFSNVPLNLSWDLQDSSAEVYYEPRIMTIPRFKSIMTQGKKGNSLIGSGSIKINNNDGFYDSIFDNVFFDNADCNVYTFHRDLAPSESQIIFRGIITGKDYSTSDISFKVSDNLFKLDALVPSTTYGVAVRDADAARSKRVIYGQIDNLLCQSLDQYGPSGIALTGTVTGASGNQYIVGTSTSFLSELSKGDQLVINGLTLTVDGVKSDTVVIVSALTATFSGVSAMIIPNIQHSNKNREFQIAGHAIKKVSTTVSTVVNTIRYEVTDPTGFKADDIITIDSEEVEIKRVSGSTIILKEATVDPHIATSPVARVEVTGVRYGDSAVTVAQADVTISNLTSGTKITLDADAEINASPYSRIKDNFNFYLNRATIWLGTPAVYTLTCVANVSASLNGTYFIIQDADASTTAFWFDSLTAPVSEPAHGADNAVAVFLSDDDLTATQVATEVAIAVTVELDYFRVKTSTDDIILESTEAQVIATPTVNTSGFSIATDITGVLPVTNRNLSELIKPRDIVRLGGASATYEVLQVQSSSITLRSEFQEADNQYYLQYKNVDFIGDDTKLFVNCLGKTDDGTSSGNLIETTPGVVEDILTDVGLSAFIDAASFTDASVRAPQLVSMVLPATISGTMPTANAAINKLNKNVFGSLYVNQSLNLGYDILDTDTSIDTLETITEGDVLSWTVKSDSFDLAKKVVAKYRFLDFDPVVGEASNSQVTYTSEFVEKYIGNEGTADRDYYLYNTAEAQESAEREALVNSLSNSIIKIRGSLNLSKYRLGQRVILDFTRLYNLLGSSSPLRVVVITSINNTGTAVEIEVEDMGALYSRGGVMSAEATPDFSSATDTEKVVNTFMTDENEIIDDDENTFGINLIQ